MKEKFMTRKVLNEMHYSAYSYVNGEWILLEQFVCKERPKEGDFCKKYNLPHVILKRNKSIYDIYRLYDKDVIKYGKKMKTQVIMEDTIDGEDN